MTSVNINHARWWNILHHSHPLCYAKGTPHYIDLICLIFSLRSIKRNSLKPWRTVGPIILFFGGGALPILSAIWLHKLIHVHTYHPLSSETQCGKQPNAFSLAGARNHCTVRGMYNCIYMLHSPRSGFPRPQRLYAYQPLLQIAQIPIFRWKTALWSALYSAHENWNRN
jgi:hypothetical protein